MLEYVALALAALHFGVPLLYYACMKSKYYTKPWDIKVDATYLPRVVIIIPTYNEAALIEKKLENIAEQEYSRDRLKVIVIDSASIDGTADLAESWAAKHRDLRVEVLREPERRGKARVLNEALKQASGEIVVLSDVDCLWPSRDTLSKVVSWFADPSVGAVSCIKTPTRSGVMSVESEYRAYYNVLRVAESKAWATPIFHGELAAFRKELLENIGGFPTDIGADDSHTATKIALMGYRAITPEDITCIELVPGKSYHSWRIRRAQHLIQHFAKTLRLKTRTPNLFKKILYIEAFLHLANPWLLTISTALLLVSAFSSSLMAAVLLVIGLLLLIYKSYRTWIATQIYLAVAAVRNLWIREIVWYKQAKIGKNDSERRAPCMGDKSL